MDIAKYNLIILHVERFILKRICVAVHNQYVKTFFGMLWWLGVPFRNKNKDGEIFDKF